MAGGPDSKDASEASSPSPVEDFKRVLESPDAPKDRPRKLEVLAERPHLAPPRVEADLRRLGTQLQLYSEEAGRIRVATALTGLGIGSALLPSGLLLLKRSDGIARSVVIGMIIGGAAQLISVPLAFIPSRMDEIHDDFMRRPISAENRATIDAIEREWHEAAAKSGRRRRVAGTILLVLGGTSLATGLTMLLASEGIFGMSRQTQYTVGGVAMGVGIPMTTISVHLLLQRSLEEISWQAYSNMKEASANASPRAGSLNVGFIPSGALACASVVF